MFTLLNDRGFQIKFPGNEYTLSVMFGKYNYAEYESLKGGIESPNAEIAVFGANRTFVTRGVFTAMDKQPHDDAVVGQLTVRQVMEVATFLCTVSVGDKNDVLIKSIGEYGWNDNEENN
jgi:hypothetical protein